MKQLGKETELRGILSSIILIFLILILPGIQWSAFAWIHFFIPLVICFVFGKYGLQVGRKILCVSLIVSVIYALVLNQLTPLCFSLTFVPVSYLCSVFMAQKRPPIQTGLYGSITLLLTWFVYGFAVSVLQGHSLYTEILESLKTGIEIAASHYRENESIATDTLIAVEQTLTGIKEVIPTVLPAFICNFAVFIVGLTLVFANKVLAKINTQPWPDFKLWQISDRFIWIPILSGILVVPDIEFTRIIGINSLLVAALIYTFQGFSIMVFFLNVWNVPRFFKVAIYLTVVLQSFGTALLITVGISNVWLNYRRLYEKKNDPQT